MISGNPLDKFNHNDYENDADETILNIENAIYVLAFPKVIIYFITAICTVIERLKLISEVESSPMSGVDEMLSEDLYNNILRQSIKPDDPDLISEYNKLSNSVTIEGKKSNHTKSVGENNEECVNLGGVSKQVESINFTSMSSKDRTSK